MIDTGSTKSFINEQVAKKYFQNYIQEDPFCITTPHDTTTHHYSAEIPISTVFNRPDLIHKHYIFNCNPNYEGLIGADLLMNLKANVSFEQGYLVTPSTKIPLYICGNLMVSQDTKPKLSTTNSQVMEFTETIPPRSESIISIPVHTVLQQGLLEYTKFQNNLEIPASFVAIKNSQALTTVINNTEEPQILKITKPLPILEILPLEELHQTEMDPGTIEMDYTEVDNIQKENLKNLRLNHLNKEEYLAIRNLCVEYRDIFYNEKLPLTFNNQIKHHIKLKDETPIFTKSYRYPQVHKEEVQKQIYSMLQQNIIRPSTSPWSSPVWVVPKKLDNSGKRKWRVVIDYRKLNEHTIDDKYPLPNITDILDKLGRAQYFTLLDLASGFHQVQMDPNDIEKTAFSTEHGHYEYTRMPFGLKGAPSTFQRVMDNVLRGIQNEICSVYLDDIIIYSASLQEHIEHIRKVFQRLRETQFKVQLDKCEFLKNEVAYLGHIITPEGVMPNPEKIKAVQNYPLPKTTREIKGFLGLVGYYRRFIPNMAQIVKPMTSMLKKNTKIVHSQEFIQAFETCKKLLTEAPILQYPDFTKPFIVTTDASNEAISGILSQGVIGQDHPIAYASRTLNDAERKYSTTERELLAVVWSVSKIFRPYLYGHKFTIYTDHRPLKWLFNLKEPANMKLTRWKLKLEEFDYQIEYKKGKSNTNADALSRIQIHPLDSQSLMVNVDPELDALLSEFESIMEEPRNLNTPTPEQVHQNLNPPDRPITPNSTAHSINDEDPTASIPILDEPINAKRNQIHIKTVILNPSKPKIIKRGQKTIIEAEVQVETIIDDLFNVLRDFTTTNRQYHVFTDKEDTYKKLCETYTSKFTDNGPTLIRCTQKLTDVLDKEEQLQIINNYHEGKTNHRGTKETAARLKLKYYWPNIQRDIEEFIKNCEICKRSKYERIPEIMPMMLTETPTKPFQILHMDAFVMEQKIFLTIIDAFSKLAQAFEIPAKTAIHISEKLITYFTFYGTPEKIISDQGKEFNNSIVKELLKLHKINVHFITVRNPQSNGLLERFHSTLLEHIRILKNINDDPISHQIKYAILAYNSSIHSTTGFTPFELIIGHTDSRNPFEIYYNQDIYSNYLNEHKTKMKRIYEVVSQRSTQNKETVHQQRNENITDPQTTFKMGQTVYFKSRLATRHKTKNRYEGPYTITKVNTDNTCEITDPHKKSTKRVHLRNLRRPLVTDAPPSSTEESESEN